MGARIRFAAIVVVVAAVCGSILGISGACAQDRVALVVGNASYRNVPGLANPVNDARLMADTLRGLGFKLIGGAAQFDLDKAALDRVVQSFGQQLRGSEVALFYYAGHGVQVRGANYLVPVNADPTREADVDFQMLDTNLVLRQMEGSGTRLNLVILDACRNNPFGERGLRSSAGGLAQMHAPEGTLISFATQPGNVAVDGIGDHSPFTKALTDTIQRPGLDLFRVFNEVGLMVKRSTGGAQQPWQSSSPISGDFYFAGRAPGVDASPVLQLKPEPRFTCSMLEQRIQTILSDATLPRDQFQAALGQMRDIEQKVAGPCEFGKLLGGPIIKIQRCLNQTTYVELGGSAGGGFVVVDSTKNYQNINPTRKGEWMIGTTGARYFCLANLTPTTILPATVIATMSVK